jgi:superfamily II DNA/RNA helicase
MTSAKRFAPMSSSPEEESGKWRVLRGLLEDWRDENDELERSTSPEDKTLATKLNKVLIFTKSRKLLDYIACTLSYEGKPGYGSFLVNDVLNVIGFEFRELHGGLTSVDRKFLRLL